jgi:phosphoglycerate dehydrogenase-like enzyme
MARTNLYRSVALPLIAALFAAPLGADIVADLGLRAAETPVREDPNWAPDGPIVVRIDSDERLQWLRETVPGVELIGVTNDKRALDAVADATAVIGFCTPEIIAAAPRLHWIQLYWAGAENCVAVLETTERDILLTNMQRVTSNQIAEHVMAMLLSLSRGLVPHIREQSTGQWRPGRVLPDQRPELGGKTMLLVGLGGIGTQVGRRAAAFDMRVTAVRASGRPGPDFVSEVARPDQLLRLAAQADVVVNSVPLTQETTALFDAKFFATMKPGAFFINVGRGQSVVTDDLVAALDAGQIAGAALDVTDPEPLPGDHPLWRLPNVIITPHIAAGSDRARERIFLVMRGNLRRYVNGEPMLSVVDVERGY